MLLEGSHLPQLDERTRGKHEEIKCSRPRIAAVEKKKEDKHKVNGSSNSVYRVKTTETEKGSEHHGMASSTLGP